MIRYRHRSPWLTATLTAITAKAVIHTGKPRTSPTVPPALTIKPQRRRLEWLTQVVTQDYGQ